MDYIKKDDVLKLLNRNSITKEITFSDGISIYDSVKNLPTADVAPKSETAKNALFELKKLIHNKAVYTNSQDIPNYVQLKVFDAILQNYINNLK